jgi:ADP-ribose pyrophosphatase
MSSPNDPWEVRSRRIVYSARPYFEVAVEEVRLPDGRIIDDYHQISAGRFTSIVAETDDGRFLMMRQYRHGTRRVGLSLPGGRIESGEDPLAGAQREFLEETGYSAGNWQELAGYFMSCTYGLGMQHYYHATKLTKVAEPNSDDLESAEVVFMDRGAARSALFSGDYSSVGHAFPIAMVLLGER